jgi:ceramide glucosyltransferase
VITIALLVLAIIGTAIGLAGLLAVIEFINKHPALHGAASPGVTILKPICGDEPLLEDAIASFCKQDYPVFQLVIGAHRPDDPALEAARRAQARFPNCDITIVISGALHGVNRKISNLINMLPEARHDVLVIADSDLHVRPDYLRHVVSALSIPGTGLVTTVSAAEPAKQCLAGKIGAMHLTYSFLPSALLAVRLGRQDCLGGTMALRRETLDAVGGLNAIAGHVADDNILGQLVKNLGLGVRLAATLPVVTIQEVALREVWQHEMRWARTIRGVAPIAHAGTVVQYPLFWALLAVPASGFSPLTLRVFLLLWAINAAVAIGIEINLRRRRARPSPFLPPWLLPLRDTLSVAKIFASYWDDEVVWRGHAMRAGSKNVLF